MTTWNVSLISDLQSVSPAVGDAAIVAGYHAPGDLGGGIFYWEGLVKDSPTVFNTVRVNTMIVDATDTLPIQITTATAHNYSTGQVVLIKDVRGNIAANGTWIITVTSDTSFNLNGSSGTGPYIPGIGMACTTIVETSNPHGLVSSQLAMIAGVTGTTNANGIWRCTVLSGTTFSIAAEWNAAWISGGTVGDGGTAIPSSASNGRWRRIYSGALNVRWFGAIGNGIADDTNAIQGALSFLGVYREDLPSQLITGGGSLFIPTGTYSITSSLIVPQGGSNSNIVIEGSGQDAVLIKPAGYFPAISSTWGDNVTVRTFLTLRDFTIIGESFQIPTWTPNTPFARGAIVTSGLSNRLLQCTTAGRSGSNRPFGMLMGSVLSKATVSIAGTPNSVIPQILFYIATSGDTGTTTFNYSTDGGVTFTLSATTGSSVPLGSTGLTATFSGTFTAGTSYSSPPMGAGFSTIHDTTVTDGSVEWTVIDGGAGVLQFNGAEIYIERVHFTNLVMGVIFDGTECSTIRNCFFECMNGVWVTGGNQRLNNPLTDPNNEYGQSNVIFVDNSWFGCSQINYAAEGNITQRLNGCNFENGVWYGWTSGVENLRVADMESEGGASGWYIGTLAPFSGNSYVVTLGILFDNCLINPKAQTSATISTVTNSSGLFEIATASPHGLYTGAWALIKGTAGAAGLNGTWTVTAVDPTHLILQGSTYSSGYTEGGTVTAVSPCIQANNIMSAPSSIINTPFQNLRLERCYTSTSAPHAITGASVGNGTTIIDPTGYMAGCSTNVASVTNSSGLFEIATEVPHGLYTGALAVIGGTAGAAGLNGTWTVTAVDPTHVILQGSTYSSGYTGGGTISGGVSNIFDAPVPALLMQTAGNSFGFPYGSTGVGCIPSVAFDTIFGYAARACALSLSAGTNSAVNGETASYLEISGPLAPFQISGFSDGVNGLEREVFNTTQYPMTLKHEDSVDEPYSSTTPFPPDRSPNRIYSPSGVDVTCTVARLRYSSRYVPPFWSSGGSGKGRWIIVSHEPS
jgi:Pectate lyase superfamily protein